MNLLEVLRNLARQNSDATIWIKSGRPWTGESPVMVAREPDTGGSPIPGYEYFLEISIIVEMFGDLRLDPDQLAQRVIDYANFDA
jgi:hypothetical protein